MTDSTESLPFTYSTLITTMNKDRELVEQAQRLRFEVFSADGEGLAESKETGRDADPIDDDCDHMIVVGRQGTKRGIVVATYRLQTGAAALRNRGYYSEQEFEMGALEQFRDQIVELGRASVHIDHRQGPVLMRLFNGIAEYAVERKCKYLFGCSSIPGKDKTSDAAGIYHANLKNLSPIEFRVTPHAHSACPLEPFTSPPPQMPKLMRLYLKMGAKFCGPPFVDKEFNSIDFPTYINLVEALLTPAKRFLGEMGVAEI